MGCGVRIFSVSRFQAYEYISSKGEKGAQESSLDALCALFQAAPDHAERLVKDSLPALRDVLGKEDLALGVHRKAFNLLFKIVQQSPHSPVVNSGIIAYVVRWLRSVCVTILIRLLSLIRDDPTAPGTP
jgi:hypothetical protein